MSIFKKLGPLSDAAWFDGLLERAGPLAAKLPELDRLRLTLLLQKSHPHKLAITAASVALTPGGSPRIVVRIGARALWLDRARALGTTTMRARVSDACRRAVQPDIDAWRASHAPPDVCPCTGLRVADPTHYDVDHAPPMLFCRIVDQVLRELGLPVDAAGFDPGELSLADGEYDGDSLRHAEAVEVVREIHEAHARLRYCHWVANRLTAGALAERE